MQANRTIYLGELAQNEIKTHFAKRTAFNLDDLKKVFGHSARMNTLDVYVHDLEKSKEEKLRMIERLRELANAIDKSLTNT